MLFSRIIKRCRSCSRRENLFFPKELTLNSPVLILRLTQVLDSKDVQFGGTESERTALVSPLTILTFYTWRIYIKTEHPVYIFFLHHSPSHLSSAPWAYVHFLPLLFLHLLLFFLHLSILCFSLSSGRWLHAEALWITELQDTVSKNCSILPQSVFLKRWVGQAGWYDATITILEYLFWGLKLLS